MERNVTVDDRVDLSDHDHLATRVYAAVISDALDALGIAGQIVSSAVRPIVDTGVVVGYAHTARSVPVHRHPERPYWRLMEALDTLPVGAVWVIAAGGSGSSSIFGGLLANAALARGARACVVDGAVRDSNELEALRFPTFATGLSVADSLGRDEVVAYDQPIVCGGVTVAPRDLVVADRDGIVVVPGEAESDVVRYALEKVSGERELRAELRAGLPVVEAFAKYGIL